jgi:hypothetical protein
MADGSQRFNTARALIAESKARGRSGFAFLLLTWAGNARRRAMAEPAQRGLFA